MLLDFKLPTKLPKVLVLKLPPIFSDYGGGNAIAINYVIQYKQGNMFAYSNGKWNNFDPLSEIFSCRDNKLVSAR